MMTAQAPRPIGRIQVGPYALPERELVTRVRHAPPASIAADPAATRIPGFPPEYRDIVDFIVTITKRIWADDAVGLIHETYDPACVVHTAADVGHGVERVVAGTIASKACSPELEDHVLNVAWSGDAETGFYSSHLGFSTILHRGDSAYGAATGRTARVRYCADCITLDGKIHTEWLARDNGAVVRQLGFDAHDLAQRLALSPPSRAFSSATPRASLPTRNTPLDLGRDDLTSHLRHLFHDIWNRKRFDLMADAYAPDVHIHTVGGQVAVGLLALRALHTRLIASVPNCDLTVEHVCWSDETDGVIGAVRWELTGMGRPGGWLGPIPAGTSIRIPGMTHCRFDDAGRIVEEWTVWDEVAVLTQIYRAVAARL